MGGEEVRHEPSNISLLQQNPMAMEIFQAAGWLQYFERLQGHDDYLALYFARNLEGNHSEVRGVPIEVSEQAIAEVMGIQRRGTKWFGKRKRVMQIV